MHKSNSCDVTHQSAAHVRRSDAAVKDSPLEKIALDAWSVIWDSETTFRGMLVNLQTVGGYRGPSWSEYKLLLIWARPSRYNCQCLHEKTWRDTQLTATLNHIIWLKLECCLSDGHSRPWHAWRPELVAGRDGELWLRPLPMLITFAFHQWQFGLICSTLALGWKPDSHSHHGRKLLGASPDVVWENATSTRGMLASPPSKVRLGTIAINPPPPHHHHLYLALPQPGEKDPANHFKA